MTGQNAKLSFNSASEMLIELKQQIGDRIPRQELELRIAQITGTIDSPWITRHLRNMLRLGMIEDIGNDYFAVKVFTKKTEILDAQ